MSGIINSWLYNRLLAIDPDTSVAADGEPGAFAKAGKKAGYNGRKAFASVILWGECYKMNCPFCDDTKQRLFFSHLAGATVFMGTGKVRFSVRVCVCHNEHCNSENPEFLKWLYSLKLHEGPVLRLAKGSRPSAKAAYGHLFNVVEDMLPKGSIPLLSENTPVAVLDYVRDRKFDPHELQTKWGAAYSPPGATYVKRATSKDEEDETLDLRDGRIVFPVIVGKRIMGWQARYPADNVPEGVPKYLTSPNMTKSMVMFNFDSACLHSVPVLVEGIFDVLRVGDRALCLFGKTMSAYQQEAMRLAFSQTGGLLVMLDPEEHERAEKIATKVMEAGIFPRGALAVKLPDHRDPADLPKSYLDSLIAHYEAALHPVPKHKPSTLTPEELFAGYTEIVD